VRESGSVVQLMRLQKQQHCSFGGHPTKGNIRNYKNKIKREIASMRGIGSVVQLMCMQNQQHKTALQLRRTTHKGKQ